MKNEDVFKWANRYGLDKFPSELRAMINDAHELVKQEDDLYTTPPTAQPAVQKDKWVGTVVDSGYGYKVIGFAPGTLTDIPVNTRCYVAAPEKDQP
jgi:hypothetical protein